MSSTFPTDVLFRRAEIIDGSGAPSFISDVVIRGQRIVEIGDGLDCSGEKIIDCDGLCLAPGFIDTHTHDDRALLDDRSLACKVNQGVTTVVLGNCGTSLAPHIKNVSALPVPFEIIVKNEDYFFPKACDYFRKLAEQPPAVNFVPLIGHGTLRLCAQNDFDRVANMDEVAIMARELDQALAEGAKGMSLGLEYPVACAANEDEILPLLNVLKKRGGILAAHIRSESNAIMEALEEIASMARRAGVPLVLSHHKCAAKSNFGKAAETLAFIEAAAQNQKLVFDAYPYAVGMTVLLEKFVVLCEQTIVSSSEPLPEMEGKEVYEVARLLGCSLSEAIRRLSPATALYYIMSEDDVRHIIAHPLGMIGSDGIHGKNPHPRLWGTFPRFLGHYVRDLKILELEEAVRKITSLPAKTFNLSERGEIKRGYFADLVLFDKHTIRDAATYKKPTNISEGIINVYVNGALTWANGKSTEICSGTRL